MEKLLKLKSLDALDKLFILQVMSYDGLPIDCKMTSQEFAITLGTTRKKILDVIAKLEEMDYIKCKVVAPHRTTKITQRLYDLING